MIAIKLINHPTSQVVQVHTKVCYNILAALQEPSSWIGAADSITQGDSPLVMLPPEE
jgi:hypothetical protein